MMQARLRLPFAFSFLILLLLSTSGGLLPKSQLPSAPSSAQPYIPPQSDKFLHFIVFFALTLNFYFIFDTTRKRVLNMTLIVCTGALSIGSEVVQGLLPNDREFDAWDVVANVVGSLCAVGLAATYHKRMLERRRIAKYQAITGEGLPDDEQDIELGDSSRLARLEGGQETGIVSIDSNSKSFQKVVPAVPEPVPLPQRQQTVEEEVDNWDENLEDDDWDEDDSGGKSAGETKTTLATSGDRNSNHDIEPQKKLAVD